MINNIVEKLKYSGEYGINFDKRIIYLFGELNAEIGTILRIRYDLIKLWWTDIKNETFSDITLDISSYGGSLYAINGALDFFYELSKEQVLVHTRAQGVCMSAATVILAGGTGTRASYPRTKFMLHDIQIEGIEGTANQVQHTVKTISEEQLELFAFYAQFARRGKEQLEGKELIKEAKKWHKKFTKDSFDHYVTPEEIFKLNLIDKIL